MAQHSRPAKPDRSRIDLSDDGIAKQWVKKLGKSKEEIGAAIAKVGDNAETVIKELRISHGSGSSTMNGQRAPATTAGSADDSMQKDKSPASQDAGIKQEK